MYGHLKTWNTQKQKSKSCYQIEKNHFPRSSCIDNVYVLFFFNAFFFSYSVIIKSYLSSYAELLIEVSLS